MSCISGFVDGDGVVFSHNSAILLNRFQSHFAQDKDQQIFIVGRTPGMKSAI